MNKTNENIPEIPEEQPLLTPQEEQTELLQEEAPAVPAEPSPETAEPAPEAAEPAEETEAAPLSADDPAVAEQLAELEQGAKEASVVELDGERVHVGDLLADFHETAAGDEPIPELPIEEEPETPAKRPEKSEPDPNEKPITEPEEGSGAAKVTADSYLIDTIASAGMEGDTPPRKRRRRRPHFLYYIGEAFRGIFSHGFMSFASVGIITACLLIMGSFSLIALNLNHALNELMDRNEFLAYVDEDYSREEAEALQSSIEAIPNVSEVEFITREEAKAQYIGDQDDSYVYDDLPDEIFRDRYAVRVDDLSQVEETSQQVLNIEGIAKISIELEVAQGFVTVRNIVMLVAGILVLVLLLISLFIISNTTKLATINRADEIVIMRICGATNNFIRWPFVYEGAILGLLGAGIAYGLMTGLYSALGHAIVASGHLSILDMIPYSELYLYVLAVFLCAGFIIGIFGSSFTIRKFLRA